HKRKRGERDSFHWWVRKHTRDCTTGIVARRGLLLDDPHSFLSGIQFPGQDSGMFLPPTPRAKKQRPSYSSPADADSLLHLRLSPFPRYSHPDSDGLRTWIARFQFRQRGEPPHPYVPVPSKPRLGSAHRHDTIPRGPLSRRGVGG